MSFTDRLAQRIQEKTVEPESPSLDEDDNHELFEPSPFFSVVNPRSAPACLDLRLQTGCFKALPYAYFVEISYDPSEGIEILTTTRKVMIRGRNLKLLYECLTAYRVKYAKANIGNDITDDGKLFIKEITIEDV